MEQNRVVNSLNMLMSLKNMEVHSNHKLWFMHWFNPPCRVFYQPCHCRIRKAIRAWYSCFAPKEVFPAIGNTQDVGSKFQFNRSQSIVGIHRNLGNLIHFHGGNEWKKRNAQNKSFQTTTQIDTNTQNPTQKMWCCPLLFVSSLPLGNFQFQKTSSSTAIPNSLTRWRKLHRFTLHSLLDHHLGRWVVERSRSVPVGEHRVSASGLNR